MSAPIFADLLDRTQMQLDAARACLDTDNVGASLLNVAVAIGTLEYYQREATSAPVVTCSETSSTSLDSHG